MRQENNAGGCLFPVLEGKHVGHVVDVTCLRPAVRKILEFNLVGVLGCLVLNEGFAFGVADRARNARSKFALLLQIGVSSLAAKRRDSGDGILAVRNAQEPEANQRGEESVTRFPRRTSSKVCGSVLVILLLSHILK